RRVSPAARRRHFRGWCPRTPHRCPRSPRCPSGPSVLRYTAECSSLAPLCYVIQKPSHSRRSSLQLRPRPADRAAVSVLVPGQVLITIQTNVITVAAAPVILHQLAQQYAEFGVLGPEIG